LGTEDYLTPSVIFTFVFKHNFGNSEILKICIQKIILLEFKQFKKFWAESIDVARVLRWA